MAIMERIAASNTPYLLGESLRSLHAESLAWLMEIDFWSDELAFFYRLTQKTKGLNGFPPASLAQIEKELIHIGGDKLVRLKNDIRKHERLLSAATKANSTRDKADYRMAHGAIANEMNEIMLLMKSFKKNVFELFKQHN